MSCASARVTGRSESRARPDVKRRLWGLEGWQPQTPDGAPGTCRKVRVLPCQADTDIQRMHARGLRLASRHSRGTAPEAPEAP